MTVGELKDFLKDIEGDVADDTQVLVCTGNEDGDAANGVRLYKNTLKVRRKEGFGKNLPYVKGDWPTVEGEKVLVIGGGTSYWPKSDV